METTSGTLVRPKVTNRKVTHASTDPEHYKWLFCAIFVAPREGFQLWAGSGSAEKTICQDRLRGSKPLHYD
jgi:hypothetical protein